MLNVRRADLAGVLALLPALQRPNDLGAERTMSGSR